ncbi:MAG: proline--tRNA ligase [Actinomycetaceae bacterium]|nr:proline--tRNA ligase [Actinomycetaceae bacterium]MDY6082991.1 proline--tRNA ligase [Actinomycetaceae bacterium]
MSNLFLRTLREDPSDAEVMSHKLLVRAGYIRRVSPGIYTWLPLGLKVLNKIEQIVREEMNAIDGQEVLFPALLPREPFEATGRWSEYGPELFTLQDRKRNDYLLAPTHEEMFTLLVKDMYSSYKELPVLLYQIQTKYRDEARPRAGLIRGREFVMKDAYSFDLDDAGLDSSYARVREAYQRIFTRLGLPFVIVKAFAGPMGGSKSEEFLFPVQIGEDTFVSAPSGYAANTEAVTTPIPPDVDFSAEPAPRVITTPHAKSIEDLVKVLNAVAPREDRSWEAGDTLKNVVVVATKPDGTRELLVIGLPGDRDVDMKRVEAALSPAEVEMALPEDLAQHPELVAGYIGPQVLGPQKRGHILKDGEKDSSGAIRYLLDTHIARGSAWVTGANELEKHDAHLVYGRDFEADGRIEAAQVREGDDAPDGSGHLSIERGIEIGHIFQLGRKYAGALDLKVLDQNGKSRVVTMGSYGIGVSRVLAALAEYNHDDAGLMWPAVVAPADVQVIAVGKGTQLDIAAHVAQHLENMGFDVLLDDRPKVSAGVKFADYELIGVPYAVVVGRGATDGVVEVRSRRDASSVQCALDDVSDVLASLRGE